jgi:glycosyltransferase involved in cell wall biosynthesis
MSVVAYLRGDQSETAFIRASREAGIPVDVVHERRRFDGAVIAQLRRIVNARDPDIVQTHNVKSHFFMRQSGLSRERLWLAFHHGYTTTDLKMRSYNVLNRWSLRGARHVVATCGSFAAELVRQGVSPARVSVLHNSVKSPEPVGEDAIRAARARVNAPEGAPLLVSIGRLSHEKGHVDLLRALARLRERVSAFHLVIVGEGPQRTPIEAARRRLNLEGHVTLVGHQEDVRPYYALADVFVLPSHSEGSPNALLEAMMAARPIVATRVGGVPEIVSDEDTALLVSPRNAAEMAHALARVLDDESLANGLAMRAQHLAVSSYSPKAYRRSLIALYQNLLAADDSK